MDDQNENKEFIKDAILMENEKEANKIAAKAMRITFFIFSIIYFINVMGLFVVDNLSMTIAYAASSVFLLIPTFILNITGENFVKIKFINIICASAMLMVCSLILNYHIYIIFIYAITISSIYFSRKMNLLAAVLTIFGVSIGQIGAFYIGNLPDNNFKTIYDVIFFGVIPKVILISTICSLFFLLSKRMNVIIKSVIQNAEQKEEYHHETVMSFSTLIESRDNSTGGHIKRTSSYVRLIVDELIRRRVYTDTITKSYAEHLIMAAPMHDIGKISVPDSILKKADKMTDEEFETMKLHTVNGEKIINDTFKNFSSPEFLKIACDVAHYHHEKWNGKGYPEGLKGEEIPLCARIMAVADVFDALSEKRCYKAAMPLDQCFEIIRQGRGEAFDPYIAEVFLSVRKLATDIHSRFEENNYQE